MRVQVPPAAPIEPNKQKLLAYIVGVALGDGNLSCPNGRTTRLRVSCDKKYPKLADEITQSLQQLLPGNRISVVARPPNCFDISVYSNKLNEWMPWEVGKGSKFAQAVRVPEWIMADAELIKPCLRGLIQTDGCLYTDRGYQMFNFTSTIKTLADDLIYMLEKLGFRPNKYITEFQLPWHTKYIVRLSRDVEKCIKLIGLYKE